MPARHFIRGEPGISKRGALLDNARRLPAQGQVGPTDTMSLHYQGHAAQAVIVIG